MDNLRTHAGRLIKETDTQVLIDNGDGTATWFQKALIEGYTFNPLTDVAAFRYSRMAVGRCVKL